MTNVRPKTFLTALFAAFLGAFSASVSAQDEIEEAIHGRISYTDEGALIKGASDADFSFGTINTLILEGDTLWADDGGAIEVEFAAGTFVRLADGSKVEIADLDPQLVLRAWNGSFYVQRTPGIEGDIIFETPVASIQVRPYSQVRIDVLSDGSTTVTVRWGSAVVLAEGGQPLELDKGLRTYIDPGYQPSTPVVFDQDGLDDFDVWNRERSRLVALGYDDVPIDVHDTYRPLGVTDLNAYGKWVYVDDEYLWSPTYVTEFVPYRHGHWSHVRGHGYVWVGYHPFSYITSHHGYWSYHDHHGWLWHYHRRHWSPAWVAAVRYGDHFVWTPVNHFGHPVVYGHGNFTVGGVHFSIGATSFSSHALLYGPSAVFAFHHGVFGHVDHHNIFVWDFHHGLHHRHPLHGLHASINLVATTLPVRHFDGHHQFRGLERSGRAGAHATDRANRLEESRGRDRFAINTRDTRTDRSIRTRADVTDRNARTRVARVSPDTLTQTSSRVSRVQRDQLTARRISAVSGDSSRGSSRVSRVSPENRASSDSRTFSTRSGDSSSARTSRDSISGRTLQTDRTSRPSSAVTRSRSGSSVDSRIDSSSTRSSSTRSSLSTTPRTTTRSSRPTVDSSPSSSRSTVQRFELPSRSSPSRTTTTGRSPSSDSRSRSTVTRPPVTSAPSRTTINRSPSPSSRSSVTSPSRSSSFRAPAPTRPQISAPRSSSPSRTPSVSRSAPSRSSIGSNRSSSSSRSPSISRGSSSFRSPSISRGSSSSSRSPSISRGSSSSRSSSGVSRGRSSSRRP